MRSAYWRVLQVYLRRPFTSLSQGIFFVTGCFNLSIPLLERRPHFESILASTGMGLVFVSLPLWLTVFELASTPALGLWPDFIRPQLAIFIAWTCLLIAAVGMMLSSCATCTFLDSAVFILAVFSVVGALVVVRSPLSFGIAIGLYFWTLFGAGSSIIKDLCQGQSPLAALLILTGAIALMVLSLKRLFTANEENARTRIPRGLDNPKLRPRMTGDGNQAWARTADNNLWTRIWYPQQRKTYGDSSWDRVQRWRHQGGGVYVAMGLTIGGVLLVFQWAFIGRSSLMFDQVLFMLLIMVPQQWLQRWKFMELESLRPVDRDPFFRELGLAMMIDFAIVLVVSLGIRATPLLLWPSSRASEQFFDWDVPTDICLVIFMFGYTVWVTRFRSMGLVLLAMLFVMPFIMLSTLPPNVFDLARYVPWIFIGLGAVSLIGTGLAMRGYRLWLKTELG